MNAIGAERDRTTRGMAHNGTVFMIETEETERHSHNPLVRYFKLLGPGLVTGASDDDPSGITTYSIAGASLGYSMLWTALHLPADGGGPAHLRADRPRDRPRPGGRVAPQ